MTMKANHLQKTKRGNIDSLVFLKEYAKDPRRQYVAVAAKLGIAKSSAHHYLHKYKLR